MEKDKLGKDAARSVLSVIPELEVVDTDKLLDKDISSYREADVKEIAERINQFQKNIDPDGYEVFYPDEEKHRKKIAMQLLADKGKEGYIKWLEFGRFLETPQLSAEIQQLIQVLKESKMKAPYNMEPFVYVDFSEDWGLEEGDALTLQKAVPLFGKLDREQCTARKSNEKLGYNKTWFNILYLREGEICSYQGRQDFGDGDGDLFQHIEAQQDFYLCGGGVEYLQSLPEKDAAEIMDNCYYVKNELLPTLKYFCNLAKIEKALVEEQELSKMFPLESESHMARRQYQRDVLTFVEESRRALNYGGVLPRMPDIRDYEKGCRKSVYNKQVMEEIEKEAKECGMDVREYIHAGYETNNKTR